MSENDKLRAEVEALRDRLAKLSEASLRISESLDLDSVLCEVADSACALTGARYGGVATIDSSGELQEFVTSGFTPEEHRRFLDTPEGEGLYAYLRDIPEPLRLRDLAAHIRALGLPSDFVKLKTFLGTPMRYRGTHVGNFYLAEKEAGREFTTEDEQVLLMFASQAAAAIANARRHRAEQWARADVEALIDTSPVGIVVFDAPTGKVVSINRETERILGDLRMPGRSLEQLLEVINVQRADGRSIPLDEFPVSRALSEATTVRAELIVVQVPDGRSVTTLVNATPIRSESGSVESVVVAIQDMAPLEELERQRVEFLGMVSHELRVPLASIKGSAATVLSASCDLDPAEMVQFFRIINDQADHMRSLIGDLLDAGRIEAGMLSVNPEPARVGDLVDKARNMFLSGGGGNAIQIDLPPDLPGVMADGRRIVQVLSNLLSNASRHSPESSPIRIAAKGEGMHVAVSVTDEGTGLPTDLLPHVFRKFVRIRGEERARGSRGIGLGLAICKGLVEAHGGRIWAESDGAGQGTRFTFTIPATGPTGDTAGGGVARPSGTSARGYQDRIRVLVVDDDPRTLRYVRDLLEEAGYLPVLTGDPEEVPSLIQARAPDLVLLDLVLPGTDGIELLARVPELAEVPVIFLSAYGRDETIAKALASGAVDYIVKPFSPTELLARIGAALRSRSKLPEAYRLGDLTINYEERRVTVAGRPVQLTATEYEVLRELSVKAGQVSTYESLLRRVWRQRNSGDVRLLRSFVKKLRRKLGDDARRPAYILTEPRVGYRMPKPSDR